MLSRCLGLQGASQARLHPGECVNVSVMRLGSKGELDTPLPAVDSTTLCACMVLTRRRCVLVCASLLRASS